MTLFRSFIVAFLLTPAPAFAACHVDRFSWVYPGDPSYTAKALADAGSVCTIHLSSGGRSGVESVTIASPPQHGSASASGDSAYPTVIYNAPRNYHGADPFSFAIKGGGKRGTGTATITIDVDVR